jgi:hypothetical protein
MADEQNLRNTGSSALSGEIPVSNWKRKTVLFISSQTISLFGLMLVQYAIAQIRRDADSRHPVRFSAHFGHAPVVVIKHRALIIEVKMVGGIGFEPISSCV